MTQTKIGLTKPTFSSSIVHPTTNTSNDGEVEFMIPEFNPKIMNVNLSSDSKGTLGKYNMETQSIKIKGLKPSKSGYLENYLFKYTRQQ